LARLFSKMTTEDTEHLTELSLRELEDELATLASHLYAGTCRWLELVAELDRRGGWAESGCGSCAEWLAWRCALAPRAARERERGSAEPRQARQASRAEALVAVAEAALAQPDAARPAGERYQVVVHVDEGVLSEAADGACELEDGSAIAPETARRLACDASL